MNNYLGWLRGLIIAVMVIVVIALFVCIGFAVYYLYNKLNEQGYWCLGGAGVAVVILIILSLVLVSMNPKTSSDDFPSLQPEMQQVYYTTTYDMLRDHSNTITPDDISRILFSNMLLLDFNSDLSIINLPDFYLLNDKMIETTERVDANTDNSRKTARIKPNYLLTEVDATIGTKSSVDGIIHEWSHIYRDVLQYDRLGLVDNIYNILKHLSHLKYYIEKYNSERVVTQAKYTYTPHVVSSVPVSSNMIIT